MSRPLDRVQIYAALRRHIVGRGNTWLLRRIGPGQLPSWWQWTTYLSAAINGRTMALVIERRGGLVRG